MEPVHASRCVGSRASDRPSFVVLEKRTHDFFPDEVSSDRLRYPGAHSALRGGGF